MKLQQLKYFLAVCATQNFTRAADVCNVAQPSLSRAINDLESELGGQLFARGRRNNTLTPLGQFVRARVERIEGEIGDLRRAVSSWQNLATPLRIGVLDSVGDAGILALVAAFRHDHSDVDVELHDATQPVLEDGLENGRFDLAFTVNDRRTDLSLPWQGLYREPFVVAFRQDHRFASHDSVRLADLADEPYVDRIDSEIRGVLLQTCRDRQIDLKAAYRSNRGEWVERAAAGGLGVAIVPQSSIVLPDLQHRPLVEPRMDREIGLVTPPEAARSPAAREFVRRAMSHPWPQ